MAPLSAGLGTATVIAAYASRVLEEEMEKTADSYDEQLKFRHDGHFTYSLHRTDTGLSIITRKRDPKTADTPNSWMLGVIGAGYLGMSTFFATHLGPNADFSNYTGPARFPYYAMAGTIAAAGLAQGTISLLGSKKAIQNRIGNATEAERITRKYPDAPIVDSKRVLDY